MRRFVESGRVARLATVDATGQPHLVPICFALVDDTVYSAVDHKPKRGGRLRRVANLEATGNASVLVDEYHEDWTRLVWVRLDGVGRMVADPAEMKRAADALTRKYQQYALLPPEGEMIAVDVRRWRGWRSGDSRQR
ncbi:MAG: TIGR03668 family PPOX class F420-dependent oxidoreductase [Micromonosporaceae bacterium]|nr:TIGR03668 family PPOX class F420-dependent oxidoreductase [Micromonosporaceae bacterium]